MSFVAGNSVFFPKILYSEIIFFSTVYFILPVDIGITLILIAITTKK